MKNKNEYLNMLHLLGVFLIILISCQKESPFNPTNDLTTAVFNPSITYGTMTDQDGNTYKTVTIGTQTWMAENLRTTKYRNGDPVPINNSDWARDSLITGAYCNYYRTTNLDTIATFGRLYNWYAVVDSRFLAPLGWHVPSDSDWNVLINYLGGKSIAGGKLKEAGLTHWETPNSAATNESGFTAISGGTFSGGYFFNTETIGFWWSTTGQSISTNIGQMLCNNNMEVLIEPLRHTDGNSVRCVKDN
jgi:uncharacterized protein (TIGR02145 family)